MALWETFVLTIGTSLAKHMLEEWLGSGWAGDVSKDLLGLASDAAKGKTKSDSKKIDAIADAIVEGMDEWVKVELKSMEKSEQRLAIEEVARTLTSARINAKMLVDFNLDSDPLRKYLMESRPEATKSFSDKATSLYNRLIKESAERIVEHAAEIPGFSTAYSKKSLDALGQISETQRQHSEQKDKEAHEFERRYREEIIRNLDRMELFGLPRMDSIARQQSLSIAYVRIALASRSREKSATVGMTIPHRIVFVQELRIDRALTDDLQFRLAVELHRLERDYNNIFTSPTTGDWSHTLDRFFRVSTNLENTDSLATNFYWPEDSREWIAKDVNSAGLVIRGRAGSGKTTLLQWYAIVLAKQGLNQSVDTGDALVPFFLRLREFVDSGFPAPENFVGVTAPMVAGEMPTGWVHRILKQQRAAVLIDGIDEVPQRLRNDMLQRLKEFMAAFPGNFCAITSRPAAISSESWPEWTSWMMSENFIELELLDMTPDQVNELISNWHLALAGSSRGKLEQLKVIASGESLKRHLRRRPEIRRLTVNPLLCAMVCAVHHERAENLPSERARLYKDCVDILLNRRDPGRKIKAAVDYPDLGEAQKERLVESIAYWMIRNGFSDATVEDVDLHFSSLLKRMIVCDDCGPDVRRFFVERTSLLREPVMGRIDFPHRTLQEYLAGLAAVEENDFGVLLDHALDDQWRETIIMAVGAARHTERARFLRDLVAKADSQSDQRSRYQLYLLAVACLETPVELDTDVRTLIMDRAASLKPPQSAEEALAFSKAGNPAVSLLGPDPDYSSEEAAHCVEALAQIGTDNAMQGIRSHVMDARLAVSKAIGKAWGSFDSTEYGISVVKHCENLYLDEMPSSDEIDFLMHLKHLNLFCPTFAMVDVSRLSSLIHLESLEIVASNCEGISSIGALSALESLSLDGMNISDLNFLVGLSNLEQLQLPFMNVKDTSALIGQKRLSRLDIARSPDANLTTLAQLKNLQVLTVNSDQLKKPGVLEAISHVKDLTIRSSKRANSSSTDVTENFLPLETLGQLQSLTIDDLVFGKNLEILATLPRLTELWLFYYSSSIPPLPELPNLERLNIYVSSASIASITGSLGAHKALKSLALVCDQHLDPSWFEALTNLETLKLLGPQFEAGSFPHLENLQTLHLDSKLAQNLWFISRLPRLNKIIVDGPGRIDSASLKGRDNIVVERT